jgi:hypothetical protein
MKILPVFLKNNIPNEFYLTNSDSKILVLEQLVCNDAKTFDISRCVIYVNDLAIDFIKGDWTNPNVFYVNGFQNKVASQSIQPFSVVKFTLKVNCPKHLEKNLEDIHFKLHLSLEEEKVSLSA